MSGIATGRSGRSMRRVQWSREVRRVRPTWEVACGVGGLNSGKRREEFGEAKENSGGAGLNSTGEGRTD